MKIVITLFIIASLLVTLVTLDQHFVIEQDKDVKKSELVKNCKPAGHNEYLPSIGIYNNTHGFDLRTCTWSPTDDGRPGMIVSFYNSFVEPHLFDLFYGFIFQYAYAESEPLGSG